MHTTKGSAVHREWTSQLTVATNSIRWRGKSRLITLALLTLGAIDVSAQDCPQDGPLALEGYAWPLSAAPGEGIAFFISGRGELENEPSAAEFLRHKADGEFERMGTQTFDAVAQAQIVEPWPSDSQMPWRYGAGWERTFTLPIPKRWPSGIYSARLSGQDGCPSHVTFIVKPHLTKRSRLAVLANVNTWLAYNRWGGLGKYQGAARVSFLRPNHRAAPFGEGSNHLTRAELWILGWLENEGRQPDVYTDIDFHNGVVNKAGYKILVLSTHPEYWSVRMRKNLAEFLKSGGSLLYLGGNGMYERAEYLDGQEAMAFFGGGEDTGTTQERLARRARALFRALGQPERSILGVATERCGVGSEHGSDDKCSKDAQGPYEVLASNHRFFRGIVKRGQTIGETGENRFGNRRWRKGQASAWEVDTSKGAGATGIPCDCATGELAITSRGCGPIADRISSLEGRIDHFQELLQNSAGRGKSQLQDRIERLNRDLTSAKADLARCQRDADTEALPANLEILARARNWCEGGELREVDDEADPDKKRFDCIGGEWKGAEMVSYIHRGGGIVFSVGSITFGGSLVRDERLQSIVRRVLDEAYYRAERRR